MALISANCLFCQNGVPNSLYVSPERLFNPASGGQQLKDRKFFCSPSPIPSHKNRLFAVEAAAKTVVSDADAQVLATDSWREFAANVSGEWDGFGADFTPDGQPVELPERAVPEAYREWEVKVFDWQTQCPTLAQPHEEASLTYKTIKLLPTVGCEADAATRYSVDDRTIGGVGNEFTAFAYHPSGSYVAVWPVRDGSQLEIEHCLTNPKDKGSRVRVYQLVRLDGTNMILQGVRVFCELWYGPFRNGDQLGGCAIRDSGFASTAATEASAVVGAWQGPRASAHFHSNRAKLIQELVDSEETKSVRDENSLLLLPRQLWCSLKESEDGGTRCELGWLLEGGRAITSRCKFSDDLSLKDISIAQESASSEDA